MSDLVTAEQELQPVKPFLQRINVIQINSAQDVEQAGFDLKDLSETKKKIEDLRISMTKPLNESLRTINSFFRQFFDPVDIADKSLRKKIRDFNEEFKKKEEKIDKNDWAGQSLALKNRVGGVKLKKVWTFKVIDLNKVPMEYFVLDEVKVRNMIRAGERDISGLEIYQKEEVSL